jgi:hypothetical protein
MKIANLLSVFWDSILFRLLLIVANIWLLMLHLWGLSPFGKTIDVEKAGSLADWFSGILTFGAVCVAVLAFRAEREKFHAEIINRDQERKLAGEAIAENEKLNVRIEAGQVYAWLQKKSDLFDRLTSVEIHLENRTSLPVYEWAIEIEAEAPTLSQAVAGPIVPGHTCITKATEEWLNIVQGGTPPLQLTFHASNGEILRRHLDGRVEVLPNRMLEENTSKRSLEVRKEEARDLGQSR